MATDLSVLCWSEEDYQRRNDIQPPLPVLSRIRKCVQNFFTLGCPKQTTSEQRHLLADTGRHDVYIKEYEPSSIVLEVRSKEPGDPSKMSPEGALRFYAKMGDVKGIIRAYKNGGTVNSQEDAEGEEECYPITGDTPLHMAITGGYTKAVDQILNMEADIEAKNRISSTPLHRAASGDQPDIVRRLLREGADYLALNKIGNTPLHCAAYGGFMEVAKLLLDASAGITIEQENNIGLTPLIYGRMSSNEMFELLRQHLDKKDDLSVPQQICRTPEKKIRSSMSPEKIVTSLSPEGGLKKRLHRLNWSPQRSRFSPSKDFLPFPSSGNMSPTGSPKKFDYKQSPGKALSYASASTDADFSEVMESPSKTISGTPDSTASNTPETTPSKNSLKFNIGSTSTDQLIVS